MTVKQSVMQGVFTVETYVRKKSYKKWYGKFSSQFTSVTIASKATI
jgi:hypothetical protein